MSDIIVATDPGDVQSAWVVYDTNTKTPLDYGLEPNDVVLSHFSNAGWPSREGQSVVFVIEMIASYGMPVGRNVFNTCLWIGRFLEAIRRVHNMDARLLVRKDIKMHMCGSNRAKDSNVTQAIVDRYGGTMPRAKGTKKAPGPLFGFKKDIWAAMAVAIAAAETTHEYSMIPEGLQT